MVCLEGAETKHLTKHDCVIVTHCWYLCCIFVVFILISFKPPKGTPTMVNLTTDQFQLIS